MSEQIQVLAEKLGISDKQLQTLRVKYRSDDAVLRRLKRWEEESRDRVRLLGKSGGYTERVGFAVNFKAPHEGSTAFGHENVEMEPEAVDEVSQIRITRDARERERGEIGDLLVAMEEVREALEERIRQRPEAAKIIGRELFQLRGRIDAAKSRLKRRMAA